MNERCIWITCQLCVDPDVPSLNIKSLPLSNPHLEKLWSFSCPLTRRRNVTCMAWNKLNIVSKTLSLPILFIFILLLQDIVAVGYGDFGFRGTSTGLVCCWSLKNPQVGSTCKIGLCNITCTYTCVQKNAKSKCICLVLIYVVCGTGCTFLLIPISMY